MDQEAYAKHNKPEKGGRPGVYTHPSVPGEELHASDFGAADAFIHQGWVWNRPLPNRLERLEAAKKAEEQAKTDEKTAQDKKQTK